jgi:hypothetical protein
MITLTENSENGKYFDEIINKHNTDELTSISIKRPRFPPNIDIEPLVKKLLKHKTKNPKMPNEFFIYRAALVQELKSNNYKIKMTKLSTLASDSWSRETSNVKSAYRRLARETERLYLDARAAEISNSKPLNDKILEFSESKKKISKNSPPSNSTTSTVNEQSDNPIIGINDIINATVAQVTPYPSQVPYEYDFTLMEDPSSFGMRVNYNQNDQLYLTPQAYSYNLDDLSPISNYSSESSPISYWSNNSSPSFSTIPLSTTNLNDSLQEETDNFFTPHYEYNININDISENYSQF